MTFLVDGTNGGTFPSWTTATRPASPAVGQMGYNTTTGNFDQYTAGGWVTTINSSTGIVQASQMPTGSVLQVVQASYGTAVTVSTTTHVTTGLTASITPKFSTSKILVLINNPMRRTGTSPSGYGANIFVYRNGSPIFNPMTNIGFTDTALTNTPISWLVPIMYLDSPATTSSTTYAMWFAAVVNGNNITSCIDNNLATIQLLEIAG